jgi:hypothetical protein
MILDSAGSASALDGKRMEPPVRRAMQFQDERRRASGGIAKRLDENWEVRLPDG